MNKIQIKSNSNVYFCNTKEIANLIDSKAKIVLFACRKSEDYALNLAQNLTDKGLNVYTYVTSDGEENKSIEKALIFTQYLAHNEIGRGDVIINIGGGTVCDLGAFVASVYMRGISYYNLPTTLLCAVDACIGGKTAINLNGAKNLWGTFNQPEKVIIDSDILSSLPENIFAEGMSEIVKYGILDKEFGNYLASLNGVADVSANVEKVVYNCLNIKAKFVQQDEFDKGVRKLLNLGHTVAHAIESASNYEISHSVAVGLGIKYETKLAFEAGLISQNRHNKINDLCDKFLNLPAFKIDHSYLSYMKKDKKNCDGKIAFALPSEVGAKVYLFPQEYVNDFLNRG